MKIENLKQQFSVIQASYYAVMAVLGTIAVVSLIRHVPSTAATLLIITVIAVALFLFLALYLPKKMFDTHYRQAEHESKILQNAIDFSKVKIRDCMIPRTDIVAVEQNTPIAELKQKFIETGVSKIIVYKEDIDNILGYVHSKELFKNPQSVQSMINTLAFVPETMSGSRMMQLFMQERRSIAIVVDEYGGTSGLLTLEDIIEEIFGDIEDEHDKDNLVERKISENEYLFSARLEIEYINETFKLKLPESDDYDTLAGFILYHHLNLPLAGEIIQIGQFTFIIRKLTNTRIDLVQMTVGV